ncbi:MAG: hypothetical protein WC748_05970 [Legionellales bacterium]|jgi:hypothetical protein
MLTQAQLYKKLEDSQELSIEEFQSICEELKNNTLVTHLDFSEFELSALNQKEVGAALGSLLSINKTITHLYLYDTGISRSVKDNIVNAINKNEDSAIKSLDLLFFDRIWTQQQLNNHLQGWKSQDSEKLTIHDFKFIFEELQDNTNVTHLDLSAFSFACLEQEEVGQMFYDLLSVNTGITDLNLDSTGINEEVVKRISQAIEDNDETAITNLNLKGARNYRENDSEFNQYIEVLLDCPKIRHLNLAFETEVDANAAKIIGIRLRFNNGLESLTLPVIDNDFAPIFEGLLDNQTLKRLDMSNSIMSDISMYILKKLLEENQHIVSLVFASINKSICPPGETGITYKGLEYLCEGLKKNRHVTELNFSDCNITDEKLILICGLINDKISCVKKINLSKNTFTINGFRSFVLALAGNTKEVEICTSEDNVNAAASQWNLPNLSQQSQIDKEQNLIIKSINAGINAGACTTSTFQPIEKVQVLKYYLQLAKDRIDDKHQDKAKLITRIEAEIEKNSPNDIKVKLKSS